tara:strand:+ start:4580 stop:4909 length:330 start_codon:yes stop_codon:yes gene_type:complete
MGTVTNITNAKFSVGELIHHRLYGYRGVIVDIDRDFQLSEDWYEEVATSRPPKDEPWYHVLVDGKTHSTYVAEQHLEPDSFLEPINHPMLDQVFLKLDHGRYIRHKPTN